MLTSWLLRRRPMPPRPSPPLRLVRCTRNATLAKEQLLTIAHNHRDGIIARYFARYSRRIN